MPSLPVPRLAAALVLAAGCSVFDASLYQNSVSADASPPATPDASPDEMVVTSAFADRCEGIPALAVSTSVSLGIDTSTFKGDYSELVACVGHDLPGNDAFVAVEMAAGEKWHVHVNPLSADFDPAVYILASCDERACSKVTAIDECGPNKSEHLSFVAPQTNKYLIGIDSAVAGGGRANVLIFKPTCGNSVVEHSETCDDGNTSSGDGCDSLCRKELSAATVTEAEPNDDPRAANVLLGAAQVGGMTAMGLLASRCDHDMYAITRTTQGTLRATISATTLACAAEGATISLSLIGSDGQTAVPGAVLTQANDCPSLEAKDLAPGEYYVVIRRPAGEMSWPYQLLVEAP
jgi:cysteine-rich repeat protein